MKRKNIGLLAGLLAVVVVGTTWAYFTSDATFENKLKTKGYGSTVTEKFTPQDDWQPGQQVDKVFGVKNTGDYPLVARVKMTETWSRGGGSSFKTIDSISNDITTEYQADPLDGSVAADKTVVEKKIDNTNWIKGADGYWYYNKVLDGGEASTDFLSWIKLTSDADMGKYTTTHYYTTSATKLTFEPGDIGDSGVAADGWVEYTGDIPAGATYTCVVSGMETATGGYAAAEYTLTITAETLQATKEAVDDQWSSTPTDVKTAWDLK